MFKKILIANRGEIVCRVIKTARKMGIATVAVYSEADKDALHVDPGGRAVCIGPATPGNLVIDKIIAACKETGAEAVHPLLVLSENANSRAAWKKKDHLHWPKHYSVAKMGTRSSPSWLSLPRSIPYPVTTMPFAEVPMKPSPSPRRSVYPVMIKASAGGAARACASPTTMQRRLEGIRPASTSPQLLWRRPCLHRKYVLEPRHMKSRFWATTTANYVHLNERDCSIQRRHQKVIEEAPSPCSTPRCARPWANRRWRSPGRNTNPPGRSNSSSGATKEFYFL